MKLFSLQRPNRQADIAPPEIGETFTAGISWRFHWKLLEPAKGVFNWLPVDQAISTAMEEQKWVMLRVVSGIRTPDWVYDLGAKPFEFSNTDLFHSQNYPEAMRMPVPWDRTYLRNWRQFIGEFGRRYGKNPSIYCVHMAGGGHIGEMNLPKAHDKWRQAGYRDWKLLRAWKRIIRAYRRAFTVPTTIAINEPLGRGKSNVLVPLVDYLTRYYPQEVWLQHNGLKADSPRDGRIRKLMRQSSRYTTIGYQMVGGGRFLDSHTGDRQAALQHALDDGASYAEVYAGDMRNPDLREVFEGFA